MPRVYTDKDKMIYKLTSRAQLNNTHFEQVSYYMISGYKYNGSKLEYVDLDIVIDIHTFIKGTEKDIYKLTLSHPDISDEVKEDVADYNKFAPVR